MNGFDLVNKTFLIVRVNGMYAIDFDATVKVPSNAKYTFGVANNSGGITTGRCFTAVEDTGNIQSVSINCMKLLYNGNNISLMFADTNAPIQTAIVHKVGLRIIRIAD